MEAVAFRISAKDRADGICITPALVVTKSSWHRLDLRMAEDRISMDATNITRIAYYVANYTYVTGYIYSNFDDVGIALLVDGFEADDTGWNAHPPRRVNRSL